MELPSTEMRKTLEQQIWGENEEFRFEHAQFELPIRNTRREFTEAARYAMRVWTSGDWFELEIEIWGHPHEMNSLNYFTHPIKIFFNITEMHRSENN